MLADLLSSVCSVVVPRVGLLFMTVLNGRMGRFVLLGVTLKSAMMLLCSRIICDGVVTDSLLALLLLRISYVVREFSVRSALVTGCS